MNGYNSSTPILYSDDMVSMINFDQCFFGKLINEWRTQKCWPARQLKILKKWKWIK